MPSLLALIVHGKSAIELWGLLQCTARVSSAARCVFVRLDKPCVDYRKRFWLYRECVPETPTPTFSLFCETQNRSCRSWFSLLLIQSFTVIPFTRAMASNLEQAEQLIPANVRMISGCRDEQTSADVSNVAAFKLPDPAGRAGGACTSAMLQVLYKDHMAPDAELSFQDVLLEMREILRGSRYTQIPQLSASRPLDIHQPFEIIPDGFSGKRHAVMIGINYVGQQGELRYMKRTVVERGWAVHSLCLAVAARTTSAT